MEELERNLLQMRSGGVSASSLPPPPGLGSPNPGGALRLEDLERKITQTAPQSRLVCVINQRRHQSCLHKFLLCLLFFLAEYDIGHAI